MWGACVGGWVGCVCVGGVCVRKIWSKARCCVLICVSFNTLSQRERVGEMNTDVHTGTMTKAEDNKEEDTATGTNKKPGCCECKFHAFSPTLPLDHMLLARGRSLLSTQQITRTKKNLSKKTANLDSSHSSVTHTVNLSLDFFP